MADSRRANPSRPASITALLRDEINSVTETRSGELPELTAGKLMADSSRRLLGCGPPRCVRVVVACPIRRYSKENSGLTSLFDEFVDVGKEEVPALQDRLDLPSHEDSLQARVQRLAIEGPELLHERAVVLIGQLLLVLEYLLARDERPGVVDENDVRIGIHEEILCYSLRAAQECFITFGP